MAASLALGLARPARAELPVVVVHGSTTFNSELLESHGEAIAAAAGVKLRIVANKTNLGLLALLDGAADLAMTSAPLSSERDLLAQARPGQDLSDLHEHAVAQTRAVLIVHPDNPLRTLEAGQVRQVLSGAVTNWAALGGADMPIRLVAARDGGGVITTVSTHFLGSGGRVGAPNQVRVATGPQIVRIVEQEPGALGITDYRLSRGRRVGELAAGEPIRQTLFLVSRTAPTGTMQAVIVACRAAAATAGLL